MAFLALDLKLSVEGTVLWHRAQDKDIEDSQETHLIRLLELNLQC